MSGAIAAGLARIYRLLAARRLLVANSGNLSARVGAGMVISRSGAMAEGISADDFVTIGLDGAAPSSSAQPSNAPPSNAPPSSEWRMHAAIYRAFPAAGAVVHTHSDAATALSCLGEGLPPFHYMLAEFGGDDVRCAPYATFGTEALARLMLEALSGRRACLLANHGMICFAATPDAALMVAEILETLARQYLLARASGTVRLLSAEQMAQAHLRYRDYHAAAQEEPTR